MKKVIWTCIIFILTALSIQAKTNCYKIATGHADIKKMNAVKEKSNESVSPRILTCKIKYIVPYRVRHHYYYKSQNDFNNPKTHEINTQAIASPVDQNALSQEANNVKPESLAQTIYVDSTDIGDNRSKQILLSEKYKDAPQIISEVLQIYNVIKISNFRTETNKIMIESSSGIYAIPKELIKNASIRYFTPELTIQLNQYLN